MPSSHKVVGTHLFQQQLCIHQHCIPNHKLVGKEDPMPSSLKVVGKVSPQGLPFHLSHNPV
jgi:hypothetical protein